MTVFQQALGIALILLLGLLGGKLAQKVKAPMVVGFILMGLLLSPSLFNVIPPSLNQELDIIKTLGLGIIALTIGGELEFKKIKRIFVSIASITIIQVIGTSIMVFTVMHFLFGLSLSVSLILGAISTASAPASPMAIIREYQAKGPFTTTLLGVVAFLDAICLIYFALVAAVVGILLRGGPFQLDVLSKPLLEIVGSILMGVTAGFVMLFILRSLNRKPQIITFLLGFVLLNSGLAQLFHLSPLLVNMMAGITLANIHPQPGTILHSLDDLELPVFIAFFLLAGASLHLDVLADNWLIAAAYIITRGIGKVGGTFLGARLAGAGETVQKYLGFGMFSKAGLTIGLIMIVQEQFPEIAPMVVAVELAAVAVCSVIGPLGERFALLSSGETKGKPREKVSLP